MRVIQDQLPSTTQQQISTLLRINRTHHSSNTCQHNSQLGQNVSLAKKYKNSEQGHCPLSPCSTCIHILFLHHCYQKSTLPGVLSIISPCGCHNRLPSEQCSKPDQTELLLSGHLELCIGMLYVFSAVSSPNPSVMTWIKYLFLVSTLHTTNHSSGRFYTRSRGKNCIL